MKPKSLKEQYTWQINRENIYAISIANFIRSLYKNTLSENGCLLVNVDESYFQGRVNDTSNMPFSNSALKDPYGAPGDYELKEISSPRLENFLSMDSLSHSKMLIVPPDSSIMLICFGKPVVDKNLFEVQLAQNKSSKWVLTGLSRNRIETPDTTVTIYPDGTFRNTLKLSPKFSSKSLTGLNMMLPIE